MKKSLWRFMLYLVSFPPFSRAWGLLARIRRPRFLARKMIRTFVRAHRIRMEDFSGSPEDYPSLADFFVRPLDPDTRPLRENPDRLLSPADGTLQQYQYLTEDRVTQVKGIHYRISDLLRSQMDFSERWFLAIIYLSPADYHRFHYPLNALLTAYCHTRGRLYPVNALGIRTVRRLFVKNERVIMQFQKNNQSIYCAAVGASFVGGIRLEFLPQKSRDNHWQSLQRPCRQNREMGRFEMGSTIILLAPESLVSPLPLTPGDRIRTGDPLLQLKQ